MRTLGLILYFLFACHGFNEEAEQVNDLCGGQPEQESQEAFIEFGESFLTKFSKRLSKKSSSQSQLKAFEAYYIKDANPRFWIINNGIADNNSDNGPKVNPAILKHTFFNSLFFPPDQDDNASMA